MSSDRHHLTSPRSSATDQRRNSLDGATAKRAPCLSIQNEAEEEAGGRNALVASTANANHHPFGIGGTIRLSTVTNTSNGGVDAASFLSSSLGQVGRDQTCLSTPFILPFEVYVKISQFVPPDLDQLVRLVSVLPPAKRDYFLRCYLKDNWSFLVHALSLSYYQEGTFRRRFPLWFSQNPDYLEVFKTDTRIPDRVREVLTDPALAIVHGSVDLLRHILDNTDADINGSFVLSDEGSRSLLEHAIIKDESACVDYLLSRDDLDVHAVILDPHRDPLYVGTPVVFDLLFHALSDPQIAHYYFKYVLVHPSCDVNRSHVFFTGEPRMTILDDAVCRALSETDLDNLPLHQDIIRMILYLGGGIPFLISDADAPSPLENARWIARNGTPQEARIGQMVYDLCYDFMTQPGYFECLQAAAAAYQ